VDAQCVTLSEDANDMRAWRRATAIRRAGPLDDALPLMHQNLHYFGLGDCLHPSAGDACANRFG
jgi:hypothetical protein